MVSRGAIGLIGATGAIGIPYPLVVIGAIGATGNLSSLLDILNCKPFLLFGGNRNPGPCSGRSMVSRGAIGLKGTMGLKGVMGLTGEIGIPYPLVVIDGCFTAKLLEGGTKNPEPCSYLCTFFSGLIL